jgi:hypothetical protein
LTPLSAVAVVLMGYSFWIGKHREATPPRSANRQLLRHVSAQ